MNYNIIFELIDGRYIEPLLSTGSGVNTEEGGKSRKRPESSSPEKLKARNKEKFT